MADEQTYTGQTGTGYGRTLGGDAPEGEERVADEPRSYSGPEARLRDDVEARLRDDPFLDDSGINVRVEGGEVTLTGVVSGSADKRRAQDLAENVSGVTQVSNDLRVESAASI